MHIACKNYFSRLDKPRHRLGGLGLGRSRARLDPNRQDGQNWLAERDTRVGALGNLVGGYCEALADKWDPTAS